MKRSNLIAKEETIKNNFKEIIDFYKVNKKAPSIKSVILYERLLAKRLLEIKALYPKYESLGQLDKYGLLAKRNTLKETKKGSLEEKDKFSSLTNLIRYSSKKKVHPPQTAKKFICHTFSLYKSLFVDVRIGLANKEYKEEVITTLPKDVQVGEYFINNGYINYIAEIEEENGVRGSNLRLKIISEEGLECSILYQSFIRGLYKNINISKKVIANDKPLPRLEHILVSGYIYVLRSLSNHKALTPYQENLFKLNFATEASERKITTSNLLTSYLESPVEIVSVIQCFSLDMSKVKRKVMAKLKEYELKDISLKSNRGGMYNVKGWYFLPLNEIEEIILSAGNKK